MSFTNNFNYALEQRGYSAYKFAKIIGVNGQSVANWKAGTAIPHPKTRQKIAEHFGITLAELDGDELPTLLPQGVKKAPTETSERELDMSLIKRLVQLTPDEMEKVDAFVQGLLASRQG
jgi:transcriptional regulator with XRE-family HTH domain